MSVRVCVVPRPVLDRVFYSILQTRAFPVVSLAAPLVANTVAPAILCTLAIHSGTTCRPPFPRHPTCSTPIPRQVPEIPDLHDPRPRRRRLQTRVETAL